jgi:hypothetical protein
MFLDQRKKLRQMALSAGPFQNSESIVCGTDLRIFDCILRHQGNSARLRRAEMFFEEADRNGAPRPAIPSIKPSSWEKAFYQRSHKIQSLNKNLLHDLSN